MEKMSTKVVTLKLNQNQIEMLKDALLLLGGTKDLFKNKEFDDMFSQVYKEDVRE